MSTTVFVNPSELTISESLSSIFAVSRAMVDSISESMKASGYDQAFPVVCSEVGGYVVDGHTRVAAAKKARVCTIPVIFRQFADETAAIEYAIRCQRNRRNLTDAELLRCIQEVDKRKQRGGDRKTEESITQRCGIEPEPSAAATAAVVGVSQRKVEQARTVIDHAPPEVKAKLDTGELSINAAYKETQAARNPKPEPPAKTEAETLQEAMDRYDQQLRQIATAKPREQWPGIARTMREVADWLDEQL